MKVEMREGQPVIEANDLAHLLKLTPADVQDHMRKGQITSLFETGEGKDAGHMRLTFFYRNGKVRLTCAEDGTVLKTLRIGIGSR